MSESIQHHDLGDAQPGSLPPARQEHCGHPLTAIRSSREGTSYCADCQAASRTREADAALIAECRRRIAAFRADSTPDSFDQVTRFVAYMRNCTTGAHDTFAALDRLLDLAERGTNKEPHA